MQSTEEKVQPESCEEPHYYGGQAVMEGVMMRGADRYAVAVRRADGEVLLAEQEIESFAEKHKWAKWPLIRGNVAIVDSLTLGMKGLFFSADVLAQEENERLVAEEAARADETRGDEATAQEAPADDAASSPEPVGGLNKVAKWATMALSFGIAIFIFVLLPTWAVDWFTPAPAEGTPWWTLEKVLRNVVEGGIRLSLLILYIVAISRMEYVRRLFEFHGAEHATINCFEAGETVSAKNCLKFSPLHPRCGTAFLFVVIIVKIILGWFFGWPELVPRMLIRFGLIPFVAAVGYEVIRWAGRHRGSVLSSILAAPGMWMQLLTTSRPDEDQAKVAIYSLAAVAPEVDLPDGWPEARRVPIPLNAQQSEQSEEERVEEPMPADASE